MPRFEQVLELLLRGVRLGGRALVVMLSGVVQIVAALLLLFEEWGWRPLADAIARLSRFRLWARAELAIAGLPPYPAFAVIALPSTLLFPLKFVAIWLVANGYFVTAAALFVGAKIVSTALIARIFMLVKPALMQLGWFAAIYNRVVPWKEAIFAHIRATWVWRYGRMLKSVVRHEARQAWTRWRPAIVAATAAARLQLAALAHRIRTHIARIKE